MKKRLQDQVSKEMSRRNFLRISSAASLALSPGTSAVAGEEMVRVSNARPQKAHTPATDTQAAVREFLTQRTLRREDVEAFLDPQQPNWAKFDPELGYTLRDNILKDGVDGCRTITSYGKTGERRTINHADRPCRINTYGDSFTLGQQASDGETWQEYLAAHFGEPIRNFGIGGYGVYQAYRRMLREEEGPRAAEYVILNVWGVDDHLRSIDAWRWLRVADWFGIRAGRFLMPKFKFQSNPWVHVRLDLNAGQLIEEENSFATPESLYKLTDPEFVCEHFKNDLAVKLLVAERNGAAADRDELDALAKPLNVQADFSSPEATAATASAVHLQYALRTGMSIVEKAQAFARGKNKKLLTLLSYDSGTVMRACEGLPRPDQNFVDFLREKDIPFVDVLSKHVQDFKSFKLSPKEYAGRYYIGHYKPQGNHFFAFAIKDALVNWLEPKPVAYREGSQTIPPAV